MALTHITRHYIKVIRPMTSAEMKEMYWEGTPPMVVELDDGTILFPSMDEEMNGPGHLLQKKGKDVFSLMQ